MDAREFVCKMHSALIIAPESSKALGGREQNEERERERESNDKEKLYMIVNQN